MRTPKEYTANIKNGIITAPMLTDCLYSVNKRAKNWRDKEREYRYKRRDTYNREEQARDEKERYYSMKETMLSIVQPICIHRETIHHSGTERIYDYDEAMEQYDDAYWEYKSQDKFIYEGSYWCKQIHDYVHFGDITVEYESEYRYYLYYDLGGNHTFHTPVSKKTAESTGLEMIDIDNLMTFGDNIEDLISSQFVQKVIDLIASGQYQYIQEGA